MKKIIYFSVSLLFFLVFGYSSDAQLFGGKPPVQNPADVSRVIVWDIARTDSLDSKDGIRPVLAYTYPGRSVLILAKPSEYQKMKAQFVDSIQPNVPEGVLVGYEYGVMYLSKFSILSKKQIRKLSGSQKLNAQALNEKEKYTLLAESPTPIFGERVIDPKTKDISIEIVSKSFPKGRTAGSGPLDKFIKN